MSDRDYLLGIPTNDLQGMREIEAKYADGCAMSRALLARLVNPDGSKLLWLHGASLFWSEHSDRATFVSLAACLEDVSSDWLDEVGRWSSKMSSVYVRTHLRRISTMQKAVATRVRQSRDTLETFGEADLYASWAAHLRACGASEGEAVKQASSVICVFERYVPSVPHECPDAVPASGAEHDVEPIEDERVDSPVTPRYIASDVSNLPIGSYVASVQKSGFRRLHIIGGCARIPGLDYANFQSFGLERPAATEFNYACHQCFREERSSGGSSSTSEADSSDA